MSRDEPRPPAFCELSLELGPRLSSLLLGALALPGVRSRRGTWARLERRGAHLRINLGADSLPKLRSLLRAYSGLIRCVLEIFSMEGGEQGSAKAFKALPEIQAKRERS
ncbi:MAG: hypothetical protein C4339_00330 [Nitrososphaerota archaeon]